MPARLSYPGASGEETMTFRGFPQLTLELADQSGKPTQLLGF